MNSPIKFWTILSIKIGRRAWSTRWLWWEKWKASVLPACNSWLNFSLRGQLEIKILIVQPINTTYFMWFKTKLNLSADNFKKILDLDGSTPEPVTRSGHTGQWITRFDSCKLITTLMSNMCAISVFLCSQTS